MAITSATNGNNISHIINEYTIGNNISLSGITFATNHWL